MACDLDLTAAIEAARTGIVDRLRWASLHWGVEDLHPDALPHIAAAAVEAVAPIIARQVAEKIAEAIERRQFDVEGLHHFHDVTCLCGFRSIRSRSRTEHITGMLDAARIAREVAR